MPDLPKCPNFLEGRCERSEPHYAGEPRDGSADSFICGCCKLFWVVSRPRTKEQGKHVAKLKRMQRASDALREQSARKMIFDYGRRTA